MKPITILGALALALALSGAVYAAPLDIDPSSPPEASLLTNEKARLNILNSKIDEFVRSHATVQNAETEITENLMLRINEAVSDISSWKDKLFLVKAILADVDELTVNQQDTYRLKIVEVVRELVTIRRTTALLRDELTTLSNEVYLLRDFPGHFFTVYDSEYYPQDVNVIEKQNTYKSNTLTSLHNLKDIVSQELMNDLEESILITKNIVDELLLIRSLDYPDLAEALESLRQFTLVSEIVQPKYEEVSSVKADISQAMSNDRPYSAFDLHQDLATRVAELINEINSSGISDVDKENAAALLNSELSEAGGLVSQPAYFPLKVKNRYTLMDHIATICMDVENDQRFNYNCSALKTIYGLKLTTVLTLAEDKLRFLESQMDIVVKGAL